MVLKKLVLVEKLGLYDNKSHLYIRIQQWTSIEGSKDSMCLSSKPDNRDETYFKDKTLSSKEVTGPRTQLQNKQLSPDLTQYRAELFAGAVFQHRGSSISSEMEEAVLPHPCLCNNTN
jgi:hypothetical protein